jgi:TonB family protein
MRLFTTLLLLAVSQLMAQDPIDAQGWLNRGVEAFKSANYPGAVAAFQKAVDADSTNVTARLYLGTAWMQQYIPGAESAGNMAAAEAAAREFLWVLGMDPGNRTAMAYLASLSLNQKKWDDAQALYEKLLAADPRNEQAWYSLGYIAWSRWYPAYMEARQSMGMKPQDPGPLPAGAVKEDLKTKYGPVIEGGLRALDQGLLINPKFDDAMAYMNLLIRERADLRDTAAEYRQDVAVADDWVTKALAVKREKGQMAGGGTGDRAAQPQRIRVGGNVEGAMLVRKVAPVYPPEAKAAGLQGTVRLAVVIGTDGSVFEVHLMNGDPVLGDAAIAAVRQWVYKPTLLNGEPVAVETTVDVNFTLN